MEEGTVVDNYVIIKHIGRGGYGDIYSVGQSQDGTRFAMKVEYLDAAKQGIDDEIKILKHLQGSIMFPKLFASGETNLFKYYVMELFGPSISATRRILHDHKYLTYSAIRLSLEMIRCIEQFHGMGFIHRDIKPANFLIRSNRKHPLCLIDFGLAKRFINQKTGHHHKFKNGVGFTGTCRYASIHAHDEIELSRRDDLVSWFYSTIELAEGKVPWPGSKDRELTERMKRKMHAKALCKALPPQFIEIYSYISKLKYEEEPNYERIKELIKEAINEGEYEPYKFDWQYLQNDELTSISEISIRMSDCPPNDLISSEHMDSPAMANGGCGCNVF